ncbi:uncharacterized protein LOC141718632 [Apium graveolens]|uniref:uncharacterized protein LOC141718632 n=1 Tax=Apium graveolens TaxID=4045 RepID=UPI003D7A318C
MDLLQKISSHGLVRGLPKLKYKKVEPCSACQLDEAFVEFKDLITNLETKYSFKLKTIRSDHEGEFEKDFINFCKSRGITHEFSAPCTPQQTGVIEHKNRTLQETARTLLHESELPRKFWAKAINNSNKEEISNIHLPKSSRTVKNYFPDNLLTNLDQGISTQSRLHNLCAFCAFVAEFEPKNSQEAVVNEYWSVAMQEELNQFERCDVWKLVLPPKDAKIVGTCWVFKNKNDEDGNIIHNKARLVTQGYNQ